MGFYDLSKAARQNRVEEIRRIITLDLKKGSVTRIVDYFGDEDTYIRKTSYQAMGKVYGANESLQVVIINTLKKLLGSESGKVRQTAINAAGEIGMTDFEEVSEFFDKGLSDPHHSVRNAVIGSLKKMGAKNPKPTLHWARQYLNHPDKEIRREICHGIELRGRTNPQDVLPLLEKLQYDPTARVRNTLVHVLGQISYKKGCLEIVIKALNRWENKELVKDALDEIVDVHERYKDFAALSQEEAIRHIDATYTN